MRKRLLALALLLTLAIWWRWEPVAAPTGYADRVTELGRRTHTQTLLARGQPFTLSVVGDIPDCSLHAIASELTRGTGVRVTITRGTGGDVVAVCGALSPGVPRERAILVHTEPSEFASAVCWYLGSIEL